MSALFASPVILALIYMVGSWESKYKQEYYKTKLLHIMTAEEFQAVRRVEKMNFWDILKEKG